MTADPLASMPTPGYLSFESRCWSCDRVVSQQVRERDAAGLARLRWACSRCQVNWTTDIQGNMNAGGGA